MTASDPAASARLSALDVFFDYASPFAYIASEILTSRLDDTGLEIRWRPIELEALSNYAGGTPYSPVKRRYVVIDAMRSAQFHGVPIQIPEPHPVRSRKALALASLSVSDTGFLDLHRALFRAAWRDQRDLSSEETLMACLVHAGIAASRLEESRSGTAGRAVASTTAEAEALGVFGVPTFALGREIFWGLDALPTLEWRIGRTRNV